MATSLILQFPAASMKKILDKTEKTNLTFFSVYSGFLYQAPNPNFDSIFLNKLLSFEARVSNLAPTVRVYPFAKVNTNRCFCDFALNSATLTDFSPSNTLASSS